MNNSEYLFSKLQEVKLAKEEVKENTIDTNNQRKLKLEALSNIEKAIIKRSKELNIDLRAA